MKKTIEIAGLVCVLIFALSLINLTFFKTTASLGADEKILLFLPVGIGALGLILIYIGNKKPE